MWLPDVRYSTLVAFITGCDVAAEGALLSGFNRWLSERYLGYEGSIVWYGLVARHIAPEHMESRTYFGDLDEAASRPLVDELFDRLAEFLALSAST